VGRKYLPPSPHWETKPTPSAAAAPAALLAPLHPHDRSGRADVAGKPFSAARITGGKKKKQLGLRSSAATFVFGRASIKVYIKLAVML
jgi:hypothetical protein